MSQPKNEVLGYTKDGVKIYPLQPGMIATCCTVVCSACHKTIRGMGGPIAGAICWDCNEAKSV